MTAHLLIGRADVEPAFMPFAPVIFDDPVADGVIERPGANVVDPVEVCVYVQDDGALVVQIDYTPDRVDMCRVRVNINDGTIYDRNIETGENFGDDLWKDE